MRLPRTECRAQPAGHACGPPLREAAGGTARRAERRQRRNHPPGPAAIVPPRQPYFVILNEVKNLFPCEPKAACGLCRARRRKTNEVLSRIYFGQGYRFFVAMLLRMTKREELRSARRVGTKLFIVRKLRGRLEYATGGNAKKWREKDVRAAAVCRTTIRLQPCEPKPRPAEARKTRPAGFGTKTFAPPVDRVGQKAGAGISAEPKP